MAASIQNAYLQIPTSKRNYIVCDPEIGIDNAGM
jgi:hypothetical protein